MILVQDGPLGTSVYNLAINWIDSEWIYLQLGARDNLNLRWGAKRARYS